MYQGKQTETGTLETTLRPVKRGRRARYTRTGIVPSMYQSEIKDYDRDNSTSSRL